MSNSETGLPWSFRGPLLNEAVRNYIKQYILEQVLKPGDALLKETELEQHLGVGRTSVREAVKALQSLGIIEVRHGEGLYVREYNLDFVLEILAYGMRFDPRSLAELLQIRIWLETAVIGAAINNMTEKHIESLDEIVEAWQNEIEAGTVESGSEAGWDQEFHRALYTSLENDTLVNLIDVFWVAFGEFVGSHRNEPAVDLEDHLRILEAVKARDPERARACIRHNIIRNLERVRFILDSDLL